MLFDEPSNKLPDINHINRHIMYSERKLFITEGWVTFLFIYYFIIFLVGLLFAVCPLIYNSIYEKTISTLLLAIVGSIGMAANGSAIFYIRKLYKLCFKEYVPINDKENTYLKRLGTIIYFLARPLFAIGFSILIIISLKSGFMLTISNTDLIHLNDGFIYLSMFLSFFVGFLSGRFINQLENRGEKVLNSFLSDIDSNENKK
jgi:hypothetical protein